MLRLYTLTARLLRPSPSPSLALPTPFTPRSLSTTSRLLSAPRTRRFAQHGSGGKLKTHQATKKRWTPTGSGSGKAFQLVFKRAYAGKSHLNSHMSSDRLNRLGATAYSKAGRLNRTLRRLLAPSL
ncbi:uncharacterized protein PFL1_04926 [Pseudozyma flocculosa PF-1]|uniref:Related to 50S ribosomal protein L35 n=2 Tax=Pseudozyma flocculosa TaxID=84751 RepID=A0A5C3EX70_9BASI|nr:uncharacterized protein PFL1_04926 [Pseudozyma flocculosa PF-1]EPQ27387.1 hypothetical protein PFL1_04926 [Pseudozyma flocculosa PF-1]SPO36196.1 related to 50S ribosomal protein L35 [Pseudozyma flocculosa]